MPITATWQLARHILQTSPMPNIAYCGAIKHGLGVYTSLPHIV